MPLLRIVFRILIMFFAFAMAALAAAAIAAGGIVAIDGPPTLEEPPLELMGKVMLMGLAGSSVVAALAGPVALVVGLVGEVFQFRSWVYYTLGGALAAVAGMAVSGYERFDQGSATAVLTAGLVAGLVYWLIAGRGAGFLRKPIT
ncbi:hypothetical protein ACKTEK_14360 [Tepidamorphus sp. 3E244]|uniref:hypothetical protein n=1 Tax=Tepidamorphus sp. 3E244 TaxID=3385498 RepID=UPI0038FCF3BF